MVKQKTPHIYLRIREAWQEFKTAHPVFPVLLAVLGAALFISVAVAALVLSGGLSYILNVTESVALGKVAIVGALVLGAVIFGALVYGVRRLDNFLNGYLNKDNAKHPKDNPSSSTIVCYKKGMVPMPPPMVEMLERPRKASKIHHASRHSHLISANTHSKTLSGTNPCITAKPYAGKPT